MLPLVTFTGPPTAIAPPAPPVGHFVQGPASSASLSNTNKVTVAVALRPKRSVIWYSQLSIPAYPACGTYSFISVGCGLGKPKTVPCDAATVRNGPVNESCSGSKSLANRGPMMVPPRTVYESAPATGGWLTTFTVTGVTPEQALLVSQAL